MSTNTAEKKCPRCQRVIEPDAPGGLCPSCLMQFVAMSTNGFEATSQDRQPPSLEAIRTAFPHLEILELVGQGGMGAVFKARQPKLNRSVALKVLPTRLAQESAFAERFEREGQMLARLSHPNIVAVYDFGQMNGYYYLIMEYVDGVNLRQAFASNRCTPPQALSLIPRICEALQFAHDEGVLHRDIKPENIMLDKKGRVKIADFGIAKLTGDSEKSHLTATGARLGTPHYMAPEQVEKPSEVDHRADIYSLGVVFYEMLTGELPLGRFAAPSSLSSVDSRIDEVVLRALEKDRELRQQSANEVRTQVELLDATGQATVTATNRMSEDSKSNEPEKDTGLDRLISKIGKSASLQASPIYRAWGVLAMVVASMVLPVVVLAGAGASSKSVLFQMLGVVAIWLGLPATILAWHHLFAIRRTGTRASYYPALLAALLWPLFLFNFGINFALGYIASMLIPRSNLLAIEIVIPLVVGAVIVSFLAIRKFMKWMEVGFQKGKETTEKGHSWTNVNVAYLLGCPLWIALGFWALVRWEQANAMQFQIAQTRSSRVELPLHYSFQAPWQELSVGGTFVSGNVLQVQLFIARQSFSTLQNELTFLGPSLRPDVAEKLKAMRPDAHLPGEKFTLSSVASNNGSSLVTVYLAFPDEATARLCQKEVQVGPLHSEEIFRFQDSDGESYSLKIVFGQVIPFTPKRDQLIWPL